MSQWKRLLFYLALNVLVSACTTLAVLWIWGRTHQPTPLPTPSALQTTRSPTSTVTQKAATQATPLPGEISMAITNVFGVGSLKDEVVVIKNQSQKPVLLANWKLEDGKGNVYTFPGLTLNANGAVQVHTAAGADTVIDLYWGRDTPVWQSNDVVTLMDDQGNIRATYRIQ